MEEDAPSPPRLELPFGAPGQPAVGDVQSRLPLEALNDQSSVSLPLVQSLFGSVGRGGPESVLTVDFCLRVLLLLRLGAGPAMMGAYFEGVVLAGPGRMGRVGPGSERMRLRLSVLALPAE